MSVQDRPLRVLMVAFAATDQAGVHRKLGEQLVAMRALLPGTQALVFADTRLGAAPDGLPYDVIDLPGGGFDERSRSVAFDTVTTVARDLRAEVVYLRYPIYDEHVLRFVQQSAPVVFEIQTKFDLEMPAESAAAERMWAARVLRHAAGLVAVTPEILEHEQASAGWAIPGHVMSNGADPDAIPFVTPSLPSDGVHLLCVASFYPWQGLDRVVAGFAAEPDVTDVHLHLVGDGAALAPLRAFAQDLGVADRVHAYGRHPGSALGPFYERAHLAIGCLAPHRKGLRDLSALKHREYALRGVPFILGGRDVDFPSSLPWVRALPADESFVSPRALRAFALAWTDVRRRRTIRQWAERELAWTTRMPPLVEFLRSVVPVTPPAELRLSASPA